MAEAKVTKRDKFVEIYEILCEDSETSHLADFVATEVERLDAQREKARQRAEQKRAEGDELRGYIAGFLTDEFQTGNAIQALANEDGAYGDVALGKVRARLTQLVKTGEAVKESMKVKGEVDEKVHTLMGYRKA